MTRSVLLLGAGVVGARAARQLVDSPSVERLLVADADSERVNRLVEALPGAVESLTWTPTDRLPPGVDAVACAVPGPVSVDAARRAVEAGVPVAVCVEDEESVRQLLDLDDEAREAGTAVIVGAGLAPGLSEVLVRYACDAFDEVDEVQIARFGSTGPACRTHGRQAARHRPLERIDGAWVRRPPLSAPRQVWFPGPVGPQECRALASGAALLIADVVPGAGRIVVRQALRRRDLLLGGMAAPSQVAALIRRSSPETGFGALHVEIRGRRATSRDVLVYGMVDPKAAATGAVQARATLAAAGEAGLDGARPGARSLGRAVPPVPFLAELAARGVRAAGFEGGEGGHAVPEGVVLPT